MRLAFSLFVIVFFAAGTIPAARAQLCNGSLGAPVFNETFGAGKNYGIGTALPPGVTNMAFFTRECSDDTSAIQGAYIIETDMGSTCKGGTWLSIGHDHTGDLRGYMMIINAGDYPSVFFTERLSGSKLCPGTSYFFGSWVMNILKDEAATKGYIEPNLTFNVKSAAGKVLASVNTGNIKANTNVNWLQFGAMFTSPTDGSDVIIEIRNNATNTAFGNDLALDDITISPCGPIIETGFDIPTDTVSRNHCMGDSFSHTLVSAQFGYTDPAYQWQLNKNDGNGWINIPGATSPTLQVSLNNAAAYTYQYRVGLLNKAQAGSENCRIYSAPLTINVYAPSSTVLPAVTNACIGFPLRLIATDGDSFLWTGPNNYTSTESNPTVSFNATAANEGTYTLLVVKNNCPLFATTTVKLHPAVVIKPFAPVTICQGESVQLEAQTSNVTHYLWQPAAGLSQTDIANPVASPTVTTTYTLTVSNDGCPDVAPEQQVTVTVLKKLQANAGPEKRIFEGQGAVLQGSAQGDAVTYYWTPANYLNNPHSLTPVATPPGNITYTLHVVSDAGCGESTSSVFVRVYKQVILPNSFSPNNDGVNDLWNIGNLSTYPQAIVSIYNRYGSKVFYSPGYARPWDGTFNGSPVPAGTYYYLIDLNEPGLANLSGWVLVVR